LDFGSAYGAFNGGNSKDKIDKIKMLDKDFLKDKNVLVVGLGRSGYAASLLLAENKAKVAVTDKNKNPYLEKTAKELESYGIKVELGQHSRELLEGKDLVVLSPGVDNRNPVIIWAEEKNIPVISEIELAFWFCPTRKIIAVSGTNGKTTVTSLIGKCLEADGKRVHVCGNIGVAFSSQVKYIYGEDYVSLEISSFQLERVIKFRPFIAVMLNFTPDHLDRYADMQDYYQAKKRLFMNQEKEDFAVLNCNDQYVKKMAQGIRANIVFFDKDNEMNENFSAVRKVAQIIKIEEKVIDKVFSDFKGIEHRLEYVGECKGVGFINDSKATNVESTLWALQNINKPIILIAGGRNKGLSFSKIKPFIKQKVKFLVLIGEAKEVLKEEFKDTAKIYEASSLEEAVNSSFHKAQYGDVVLLSPMCASFDMFKNYEERGDAFRNIVKELIKKYA